eukprot:TRINITY_DN7994_c0_g1_i1.p1 TRINITY_DN7994_c0_g1~~TRINITY_DN7994_c0_g1_i1.p1  ORF type:complete len:142 (+),score=34.02 TRINITY_DN7994_c0_g1_i1:72-497(+)
MCIRDRAIALLLAGALGFEDRNYTCWDVCRWRCKATTGRLTADCIDGCGCTCNTDCDRFCVEYGLGWACRFKCGCYQDFNFSAPGKLSENVGALQEVAEMEEGIEGPQSSKGHKKKSKEGPSSNQETANTSVPQTPKVPLL